MGHLCFCSFYTVCCCLRVDSVLMLASFRFVCRSTHCILLAAPDVSALVAFAARSAHHAVPKVNTSLQFQIQTRHIVARVTRPGSYFDRTSVNRSCALSVHQLYGCLCSIVVAPLVSVPKACFALGRNVASYKSDFAKFRVWLLIVASSN